MSTLDDILGKDSPEVGIIDTDDGRWLTNRYWMVKSPYIEDLTHIADQALAPLAEIGPTEPLKPLLVNGGKHPAYSYSGDTLVAEFEHDIRLNAGFMATVEDICPPGTWERPTNPKVKVTAVYRVNGEIVALLMGVRP